MQKLTTKHLVAMEGATSMHHLAEVAVDVLASMLVFSKPVIQICGPMSTGGFGNFRDNIAHFELAVERAVQKGFCVFNQIPFQDALVRITGWVEGMPYDTDILEVFYRGIFESGHISKVLFLSGWESSRGAVWERELATKLGIEIEEYPMVWLS